MLPYGRAADCVYRGGCSKFETLKGGKTEADLTGTDFKFPPTIPYKVRGWPACSKVMVEPTMSADRKKWSVRCGGYCGGCSIDTLVLELNGC